tara:strand:+ start:95 stop:394 length:300 start_codon:yes stop_codon:yes gene_type:complete
MFLFWRFFALAFLLFFTWNAVLFYCQLSVFGIVFHIIVEIFKNRSIDFSFIWDQGIDFIGYNLLAIVENPNLVIIPLKNYEQKKIICKEINTQKHNSPE